MTREEMYALARTTLEAMALPSDIRVVLVVSDLEGDSMTVSGNCCKQCTETLLACAALATQTNSTDFSVGAPETVH